MSDDKARRIEDLEENEYLDNRKIIGGVGDEHEISSKSKVSETMPSVDTSRKKAKIEDPTKYIDEDIRRHSQSENEDKHGQEVESKNNDNEKKELDKNAENTMDALLDNDSSKSDKTPPEPKFDATRVDPVGEPSRRPIKRHKTKPSKSSDMASHISHATIEQEQKENKDEKTTKKHFKLPSLSGLLIALHIKKKPEVEQKESEDKQNPEKETTEKGEESDKKEELKSIEDNKKEDKSKKKTSRKSLILIIVGIVFLIITFAWWYITIGHSIVTKRFNKEETGEEIIKPPIDDNNTNAIDPNIPRISLPETLEEDSFIDVLNSPGNYSDPDSIIELLQNSDIDSVDNELQQLKTE